MAQSSPALINVLRATAQKLETSNLYQWGHMGACNCGFLAQEITHLSKSEIHQKAMLGSGDWSEQLNDYCPTSGLPMDTLITELLNFGFDADDLRHLEKLSDGRILRMLPPDQRNLKHNLKKDAVTYLKAWVILLEEEFIRNVKLGSLTPRQIEVIA